MTPFDRAWCAYIKAAPVLGIHRLPGAAVERLMALGIRYAKADDGTSRIVDLTIRHDDGCPCLADHAFLDCTCAEVEVTFRDLTHLPRRQPA